MLALLWVISAAIPAVVVWAVMRPAARIESRRVVGTENYAATKVERAPEPITQQPAAVAAKPAESIESTAPVVSASAATSSAPAADSATLAPSTVPVVVETDSQDRVSVLVKSKPKNARVYKRGKEIGKTPLVIQIGKGEHRIFEVGPNLGATRRVSIDGEKPEITVTLVTEIRPAPSAAAPPPSE